MKVTQLLYCSATKTVTMNYPKSINTTGDIMTKTTVTEFIQAVEQDSSLKNELIAAVDVESYYQIARNHGYNFTAKELQEQLSEQSQEDLAGMINPGMAPRKHLGAQ
jgi:predicted ribosomally synthesized peptide with nif11-like leader